MSEGEVVRERATVEEQEVYEGLRVRLRHVEGLMHPARAHLVDMKALAFIVDALAAVDAGERMPPKPNAPPVAKPGRGRGFKAVVLTAEEQAELDATEAALDAEEAVHQAQVDAEDARMTATIANLLPPGLEPADVVEPGPAAP